MNAGKLFFHWDNAPAHIARSVQEFLIKKKMQFTDMNTAIQKNIHDPKTQIQKWFQKLVEEDNAHMLYFWSNLGCKGGFLHISY